MTYPYGNLSALTDNVSLLVIANMFIFFFCLNNVDNVQYVIYGNSANKQTTTTKNGHS